LRRTAGNEEREETATAAGLQLMRNQLYSATNQSPMVEKCTIPSQSRGGVGRFLSPVITPHK